MEFVQLQINYGDWENPAIQSRACYEMARKYGKPVIVMEPVKKGILTSLVLPCGKKLIREEHHMTNTLFKDPVFWTLALFLIPLIVRIAF